MRNLGTWFTSMDLTSAAGTSANQGYLMGKGFGKVTYEDFTWVTAISGTYPQGSNTSRLYERGIGLDALRQVPVGAVTAPRRFGALACAWLGLPHIAD